MKDSRDMLCLPRSPGLEASRNNALFFLRKCLEPLNGLVHVFFQQIKRLFGIAFVTAFHQILNFFFLLKLSAVCTFWIVLMC